FSEKIALGTGNITIYKADGTTVETISNTETGKLTIEDNKLIINPTQNFAAETQYYVQIGNGAIKDLAGNSYNGISDATTWKFTTADITTPTLSNTTPNNNAINVAVADNLVINFSEKIALGKGNITIYKADGTIVEIIASTDTAKLTIEGSKLTINPSSNLTALSEYYVQIQPGAIKDLAGNDFSGISNNTTWKFATQIPSVETFGRLFNQAYRMQTMIAQGQNLIEMLFDNNYYLENNLDVKAGVAKGDFSSGLEHFLQFGQFEGRNPSVLFDNNFYLSRNLDVAAAVAKQDFRSGFEHFIKYGFLEQRDLSMLLFDEATYLASNLDVKAAVSKGDFKSGYHHFLMFGQSEGRNPSSLFDSAYYLAHNQDVADAVAKGSIKSAFDHFVRYGMFEGRDPNANFNTKLYLQQNPDIAKTIELGSYRSGFEYALRTEQFDIDLFDSEFYLSQNQDVAAAVKAGYFRSAFDHFIQFGQKEKRSPSKLYNENFYLDSNLDVAAAVANGSFKTGFEHFLLFGKTEGRKAMG
ncbi:Ig-like domain-containing protein, partial [Scytonema sp. NUACC26]|uniref:Ig-like domain-containing protein n=1 Tax=Scytonema sp. NUACC26 TaxID=3140176 RepID=UPI0038B3B871